MTVFLSGLRGLCVPRRRHFVGYARNIVTGRSVQIGVLIVAALAAGMSAAREDRDWPAYGGGPEQARYSTLAQIDRSNVGRLELAWTYDSGETGRLQTNPIIVRGMLYTTTPRHKVVAIDGGTGHVRWKFDSGIEGRGPWTQSVCLTPPGVVYKDPRIVGGRVSEGLPASPGDTRAYDVRSGAWR